MNQLASELEPTLPALSKPPFVERPGVVVPGGSDQLANEKVQMLIAEGQQMERATFHNVDISKQGAGFGRAYVGQIRDAIKIINSLTPEMLATEEGQKVLIAAAEQLFAERSFSQADMAKVQVLLRLSTLSMLSPEMIAELKGITLATLEERLERPSELALKYNANRISRDEMSLMMAASYDWAGGRSGGYVKQETGYTDIEYARARALALWQYNQELKEKFESVDVSNLSPEERKTLTTGLGEILDLLNDQSNLIQMSKKKKEEENDSVQDADRIASVKLQIEQFMAQLNADGVVTDGGYLATHFAQPGSLAAYQSLQELIAIVKNFKATLLGKDSSEVEIGPLGTGVTSLSTFVKLEEDT